MPRGAGFNVGSVTFFDRVVRSKWVTDASVISSQPYIPFKSALTYQMSVTKYTNKTILLFLSTATSKWFYYSTHRHTQPFYCSSGICPGRTTRVSRYQKGKTRKVKTNLDLLEQEIVSGSGICWAICKSAPHPRQPRQHPTTQFFYRPDALPADQPTASKHWRQDPTTALVCDQFLLAPTALKPSVAELLSDSLMAINQTANARPQTGTIWCLFTAQLLRLLNYTTLEETY